MTPANRRILSQPPGDGPSEEVHSRSSARGGGFERFATSVRTAFGIALVIGASVGVAWFAHRHVTTSARFAVDSIQVVGSERRSAEAIIAESGIALGSNVFSVDLDVARGSILADAWIADAALSRRLPRTIIVQVTERRAAALVALGDTLLATADGEPFKTLEPGDPVELPVITGLTAEAVADDREEARRMIRRSIDLAAEYERGGLARRAPLEEVHVDPGGAYTLVVGRPAMQIALGGPPFRRKLDEVARVVAELDRRRAQATAIMLDNDARPERVVARLR
jgi:cell division protein FtsQ